MSGYLVLPENEIAGHTRWPWDDAYRPVVGVFEHGRLAAHGECRPERPMIAPRPARDLRSRLARRLLGRQARAEPLRMEAPPDATWFRFAVSPDLALRLRSRDSSVTVARLEDGERLNPEGAVEAPASGGADGRMTLEELLDRDIAGGAAEALDGFPIVAALPASQRLDLVFLDYLQRLPDSVARDAYAAPLETGGLSVFELRQLVMQSEEFGRRRIGSQDRPGAILCSSVWREIVRHPTLETAAHAG